MPVNVTNEDLELLLGSLVNKATRATTMVHGGLLESNEALAIVQSHVRRFALGVAKMYAGTARIEDGKFVVDDDDADPRAGGQAVVPKGWRDGSSN